MYRKLIFPAFVIFLFSCSKDGAAPPGINDPVLSPTIIGFNPATAPVDSIVTIAGAHFDKIFSKNIVRFNGTTAQVKSGNEVQLTVSVPAGATTGKITVTVDTITAVSAETFTVGVSDQWVFKADFHGAFMHNIRSFSIRDTLYFGFGQGYSGGLSDFWQYVNGSNDWSQKASYPGSLVISDMVGFSIGGKGYILDHKSSGRFGLWQYDPMLDKWIEKSDFPGDPQIGLVAFSIHNFGYVGLGDYAFTSGTSRFWQYDPATDTWTQKADFPGKYFTFPASFVVGDYAYVGTGMNGQNMNTASKEFYRYDPVADVWTKKADFPGVGRGYAAGFSIGEYGYLGTGNDEHGFYLSDFWQYNPTNDQWLRKKDFGGGQRGKISTFPGAHTGYFGFGTGPMHQPPGYLSMTDVYFDLWQYQP